MNAELLEKAVKYHGTGLFNLILKQNNCISECIADPTHISCNFSDNIMFDLNILIFFKIFYNSN